MTLSFLCIDLVDYWKAARFLSRKAATVFGWRPAIEDGAAEVLSQERDRRAAGNVFDPLLAGNLLVANFLAEGLADNCCYLKRRQFDGARNADST